MFLPCARKKHLSRIAVGFMTCVLACLVLTTMHILSGIIRLLLMSVFYLSRVKAHITCHIYPFTHTQYKRFYLTCTL